ncbi:phosphohydrolase [Singulisphaera sp. Ch08]|uniref:Phosphohydrolase n=1 Tax=Singulisphaera sp. Ch08 TaxID=3120278 RepID=A0AAU7CEJ4_9BACT
MHDRFRKPHQTPRVTARVRSQIAVEAARRMYDLLALNPGEVPIRIGDATENEYYSAKRKAAAVLGHRVRPGDLPSDAEVREQVVFLANSRAGIDPTAAEEEESEEGPTLVAMADHVDRFAIYKMRLEPLESVKQNPFQHPEGDALFHSLQVFERARHARPYDEEFLLAALLHDVGKAIDPKAPAVAGVEALRGAVTERTLWLIEHLEDLAALRDRTLSQRDRRILESSEYLEDLKLLRDLDEAGRVPGTPVETVDQALAYLRGLEDESYLEGNPNLRG